MDPCTLLFRSRHHSGSYSYIPTTFISMDNLFHATKLLQWQASMPADQYGFNPTRCLSWLIRMRIQLSEIVSCTWIWKKNKLSLIRMMSPVTVHTVQCTLYIRKNSKIWEQTNKKTDRQDLNIMSSRRRIENIFFFLPFHFWINFPSNFQST